MTPHHLPPRTLEAAEENRYLGWDLDVPIPDEITAAKLAEATRRQPAIPRYRPCNFELCLLSCPVVRGASGSFGPTRRHPCGSRRRGISHFGSSGPERLSGGKVRPVGRQRGLSGQRARRESCTNGHGVIS